MKLKQSTFELARYWRFISFCGILIFLISLRIPRQHMGKGDLSYNMQRSELYESLEEDLEKHGPKFLEGGNTSQSLAISDIFMYKEGKVQPVLKPAEPPVRAIVLHLNRHYAVHISDVVKNVVSPIFRDGGVWYQDSNAYHFSLFHASHHLEPRFALPVEIEAEVQKVKGVVSQWCELSIVLERIVLTSTGVLLGLWQVHNGTDPAIMRKELRKLLPYAPSKQLYNEVMLHTTFARLLSAPKMNHQELSRRPISLFKDLVSVLNKELNGFIASINEVWYVEEQDLLALALKGHMKIQSFPLECSKH